MRGTMLVVGMLLACATSAAAQEPDSVIRIKVNAEKRAVIERTMRAFVDVGLTVTDVDQAGLVKALGHEKGDVTVTYTAAILPTGTTCDVIFSAFARYQPFAAPVNPLGAQVTAKTKGGEKVWKRLVTIAGSLGGQQTR